MMDLIKMHPRALVLLFFTEMWERFSYYGMRALLILYLVTETAKGGLGWSSAEASQTYGIYTGLVYVTPLIGSYLADRFLGNRIAILIGAILMTLGHVSLALDAMPFFYGGLALLIVGNGFFKPNISSMVGQLYPQGSKLKDSAYTIFYMGINIGALLGTFLCGLLGEKLGWHYGFGMAGVGMFLGLVVFWIGQGLLGEIGKKPVINNNANHQKTQNAPLSKVETDRLWVILSLSVLSILFWLAFEQAGSSLNIFAYKYTDRYIPFFDFEFPASWLQMANPLLIFILAPVFSALWVGLNEKGLNPSGPVKFGVALLLLAIGFLFLVVGSSGIPNGAEKASVSVFWLLSAYLFHTMGELCLSPVGLSYVNKLAPSHYQSMVFGVWFFASAIGNYLGSALAGYIDRISKAYSMSNFFLLFVVVGVVSAIIVFLLSGKLRKLMHGIT